LQFGLRHPELVSAVLSLGGYLFNDAQIYDMLKANATQRRLAKKIPVMLLNGRKDWVVKPDWARKTVSRLKELGVPAELKLSHGKHELTAEMLTQATDFMISVAPTTTTTTKSASSISASTEEEKIPSTENEQSLNDEKKGFQLLRTVAKQLDESKTDANNGGNSQRLFEMRNVALLLQSRQGAGVAAVGICGILIGGIVATLHRTLRRRSAGAVIIGAEFQDLIGPLDSTEAS